MSTTLTRSGQSNPSRGELNWDDEARAWNTYLDTNAAFLGIASTFTADQTFSGRINAARLYATGGTAQSTGNVTLGANWGTGAAVTSIVGNDTGMRLLVTVGTTCPAVSTLTINYVDGAFAGSTGFVFATVGGFLSGAIYPILVAGMAAGNTQVSIVAAWQGGTPAAGQVLQMNILSVGRS